MFRRTSARRMIPYLHAFSPGARPSEKGMLYRNNNQNAHARVASIQIAQRTALEGKIFFLLFMPDQIFAAGATVCAIVGMLFLYYREQPFTLNAHKQRWMMGGMNEHERYQRSDEMQHIFEAHQTAVNNTRAEIEQPSVFSAPTGYTSTSGLYRESKAAK